MGFCRLWQASEEADDAERELLRSSLEIFFLSDQARERLIRMRLRM